MQQDMCLWNMDAPAATKSKYVKIFKSYIFTPPNPKDMWCQWGVNNLRWTYSPSFAVWPPKLVCVKAVAPSTQFVNL